MNATGRSAWHLPSRHSAGLAIAAAVVLLAASTAQAADETGTAWEKAGIAYETQHYAAALAIYKNLALAGDAQAARLAGEMLLLAPALNDKSVPYDPVCASRWLKQAASAGSASAQFLVRRIEARALSEPESSAAAPYEPGPHGC
jgi:TPR repeat protein